MADPSRLEPVGEGKDSRSRDQYCRQKEKQMLLLSQLQRSL
jgi:hypothetical protein